MRRLCLILFGAPGAGKGTQAKLLQQSLQLQHISTGDILREQITREGKLGKLGKIVNGGGLVPDEIVNYLISDRIGKPDCARGFILDGYPRNVDQAAYLQNHLSSQHCEVVIIHMKFHTDVLIPRLLHRRQCPVCGSLFSASSASGPATVCEYDGATLVRRDDDRPEIIAKRFEIYDRETHPVIHYFQGTKTPLVTLEDVGPPDVICSRIQFHLEQFGFGLTLPITEQQTSYSGR